MHRVNNKEGIDVRAKADLNRCSRARKSKLLAHLPCGTIVHVGEQRVRCDDGGTILCRVEAGDVAGWAVYSHKVTYADADNEWGWRDRTENNFVAVS